MSLAVRTSKAGRDKIAVTLIDPRNGMAFMPSTSNLLSTLPFFSGLSDESLHAVEAVCRWETYDAGGTIIGYLETTNDVFFLVSGKGRVIIYSHSGKAVAFRDILVGDIFGELAAIQERPRSASIEAVEESVVARVSRDDFWELLRSEAMFMEAVVKHLAQQVQGLTSRIYEFSTLAVRNRIHAEIYRLALLDIDETGRAHIRPMPHHSEIASRVSTTREAVARELSYLSKLGVLRRTSNELEVTDLDRLKIMIHEATGEMPVVECLLGDPETK